MERRFIVDLARYHREDKRIYVLQGYFEGNSIAGSRLEAYLGRKKLEVEVTVREGLSVRQKYFAKGPGYEDIDREYDLWIKLPEEYEKKANRYLKVYQNLDGRRRCVFRRSVRALIFRKRQPDCALTHLRTDQQTVVIGGWAVGNSPCRIQVLDASGEKLRSAVRWTYRQDIVDAYPETMHVSDPEALSYSFEVRFEQPRRNKVTVIAAADGQKKTFRIHLDRGLPDARHAQQRLPGRLGRYYRRYGFRQTCKRILGKLSYRLTGTENDYMAWRAWMLPGKEEIRAQSRNVFLHEPLISIVVPLYRTPVSYLRQLVASVERQTYGSWQLILADGSGSDSPLTGLLSEFARKDKRIRILKSDRPCGISENTNRALARADGEYILFADHDDLLPEFAVYECVRRINEEPEVDLIYSDEDQVGPDGKEFFAPHFKPDFNIDLLCSMNYFGHMLVVRRDLLEKTGVLNSAYDGAQDYDFVLRCAEQAGRICHIPKVLYHVRSHPQEEAGEQTIDEAAWLCGLRAVQAHYDRTGVQAQVSLGQHPGLYRTTYLIPDPAPRVSVIIPNKDHAADLRRCIDSIMEKTAYPDLEFVIVENNSTSEETFALYEELQNRYDQLHVTAWEGEFNYADINNFALNTATGSYLLFLNNDTSMISEDTIEELLGPCLRDEVGVVGARLYYGDNTIQHAGVIIGYGGSVGHAFRGLPRSAEGYFSRIVCQSDLSAVTAACMMVKRSVFEELGGFDSMLKFAYNDIDFCLRAREKGYLVVYNPYAQLYHYEGRTRINENSPERVWHMTGEADEFLKRWLDILKNGDPYYNPNLSLETTDFRWKSV